MDFTNQYLGLDKSQKLRTTIEVGLTDVAILRSYDPKEGVMQTTFSILTKKLINELKRAQLQPGDFSGYQHSITTATIVTGKPESIEHNGCVYIRVDDTIQRSPTSDAPSRRKRARPAETA